MSGIVLGSNAKKQLEIIKKQEKKGERNKKIKIICYSCLCYILTATGGFFLANLKSAWFSELAKPSFLLPPYIFYTLWLINFAVLSFIFSKYVLKGGRKAVIIEFLFNAFLIICWALFFFTIKSSFAGLVTILILYVYSIFLFKHTKPVLKKLSFAFYFYFAVLSYATLLNYCILLLN